MTETRRRGRRQDCDKAARSELASPVAEHSGREAVRGGDYAGMLRRRLELCGADRGERQVPERTAAVPALVAGRRDEPFGARMGIEPLLREPLDPSEPVPSLPATLSLHEVLGEDLGLGLGETELPQARERLLLPHVGLAARVREGEGLGDAEPLLAVRVGDALCESDDCTGRLGIGLLPDKGLAPVGRLA
jgi:hypothetical protein